MVIHQYHTTYQSDYTWPYVKSYGLKSSVHSKAESGDDDCDVEQKPLLDLKLQSIKFGECPQSEISTLNQPNVFLEKLKQKYPFIYECLQSAPPNQLVSRINRERLTSTYQNDYCKMRGFNDNGGILRAAGFSGSLPTPKKPVHCRKHISTKLPSLGKNITNKHSATKSNQIRRGSLTGTTEYQDAISKLGNVIMREKIHYKLQRC